MSSSSLLLTRSTSTPIDTVWARLPAISTAHTFGVQATHNLREKIETKGIPFPRECRVLEVCNPRHAATVLGQSIAISTALPCRIAVYEEEGRTILATLRPSMLLTMFDAPGAAATAQEVEDTLVRIMDEACQP